MSRQSVVVMLDVGRLILGRKRRRESEGKSGDDADLIGLVPMGSRGVKNRLAAGSSWGNRLGPQVLTSTRTKE